MMSTKRKKKLRFKHVKGCLLGLRANGTYQKICDDIRVTAHSADEFGEKWCTILEFLDRNGECKEKSIPIAEIDKPRVFEMLSDSGFRVPSDPNKKHALKGYLARKKPKKRYVIPSRPGWHDDPKKISKKAMQIAYKLSGAKGRLRSALYGHNGELCEWRCFFLSASETALFKYSEVAEQPRLAGEEVRWIDVPAVMDNKHGIFKSLPKGMSSAELYENIEAACQKYYGTAFPEFISCYLKKPLAAKKKNRKVEK